MLQYFLESLGGRQFKCFELSSQATRKPGKASANEEKDDEEIDAGFDYILECGPRSSSEMAQQSESQTLVGPLPWSTRLSAIWLLTVP